MDSSIYLFIFRILTFYLQYLSYLNMSFINLLLSSPFQLSVCLVLQISLVCLASSRPPWMRWFLWPKRWSDWGLTYLCWSEEPPHQSKTTQTQLNEVRNTPAATLICTLKYELSVTWYSWFVSDCYSLTPNMEMRERMESGWIYNSDSEAHSACVELK